MSDVAPRLTVVPEDPAENLGLIDALRRRVSGQYQLDPWGLDDEATRLAARIAALRWHTSVVGLENLPADGPAMLVANRRLGWSEPAVVVSTLLRETGVVVRPAGGIDIDPLGGIMRRLGAIPARADEIAAALRRGNLVLVPTRREPMRNRAGHLPVELLAPAVQAGVPLIPVAVIGWEFSRRWTVRIGEAVRTEGSTGDAREDARLVGTAAVAVSSALDDLLAGAHEFDVLHRILAKLPGSTERAGETTWEVS